VIIYNADLFEANTIACLCHHFQTLLEGIVANPETPLSALPLLTIEEQQRLLQYWHNHRSKYPADVCIHHLFEAQVRQRPTAIAIQFRDRSFTYQQLNQGSNQLARYLHRLGIRTGMLVGICLERSVEAIAAMLAILKVGGTYVPLDPSYPSERLHLMLADAGIRVVLTQADWVESLQNSGYTCALPQAVLLSKPQISAGNCPLVDTAVFAGLWCADHPSTALLECLVCAKTVVCDHPADS
jgi:non-ribosomal peptide synthetase component F